MQFIFSTGSLHTYGIDRCFDLAAQAGFDGIELMVDHRWDTRQADYLQRLVNRYNQPVIAVHSPFAAKVPGWPSDEPGRIRASVKLAEDLGAKIVVHHLPFRLGWVWVQVGSRRFPFPLPGKEKQQGYGDWLLGGYENFQAGTAVVLCIENMPARRWLGGRFNAYLWNSLAEIARFPNLTLDTTHLATWNLDANEIYPQLQDNVRHIHLSNFDGREHRRPEVGQLRLDRLLVQLAKVGYLGAISLELHPDTLEAGGPDDRIVTLLANSLAYCRAEVKSG